MTLSPLRLFIPWRRSTTGLPAIFTFTLCPVSGRTESGSRLLAHLEQAAWQRGHRVLETTIAREDEQSCGFLAGHGFKVVGQTVHLARAGMEGLPPVNLPEGYRIASVAELGEQAMFYLETANRLALTSRTIR